MPQTASARLATDVQNAGVALLPCFVEALMPVIDSANNYNIPHWLRKYASLTLVPFKDHSNTVRTGAKCGPS